MIYEHLFLELPRTLLNGLCCETLPQQVFRKALLSYLPDDNNNKKNSLINKPFRRKSPPENWAPPNKATLFRALSRRVSGFCCWSHFPPPFRKLAKSTRPSMTTTSWIFWRRLTIRFCDYFALLGRENYFLLFRTKPMWYLMFRFILSCVILVMPYPIS